MSTLAVTTSPSCCQPPPFHPVPLGPLPDCLGEELDGGTMKRTSMCSPLPGPHRLPSDQPPNKMRRLTIGRVALDNPSIFCCQPDAASKIPLPPAIGHFRPSLNGGSVQPSQPRKGSFISCKRSAEGPFIFHSHKMMRRKGDGPLTSFCPFSSKKSRGNLEESNLDHSTGTMAANLSNFCGTNHPTAAGHENINKDWDMRHAIGRNTEKPQ